MRGCWCPTFSWICSRSCSRKTMCTFTVSKATELTVAIWYTCSTTFSLWRRKWGPSLSKANSWKDLGRPLLSMIACIIRSKALVPHHIIQTAMGEVPIIIIVLFWLMTSIHRFWELPKGSYSRLALASSKQLYEHGDVHCWYAEMKRWFEFPSQHDQSGK